MSDRMRGISPDRAALVASLAGGAVSGLLYSSIFLSMAFLIPVQVVFGRSGTGPGLIAAGVSAAILALSQVLRMLQADLVDPLFFLVGLAPPVLFLAALSLMNAKFWRGKAEAFRVIAPSAICALFAIPALVLASRERVIAQTLEEWIGAILASAGGEGSVLAANLDPAFFVEQLMTGLNNSFAATIFMVLGLSWMIGNRLAGPGSRGRELAGPIDGYKLPYAAVWVFLAAWASALAVAALRAPAVPAAIAWNLAFAAAMAYGAQGLGVAVFLLKKWNAPRGLRIAIAVISSLALLTPTGIVIAIALPLLGITETWIPYRNLKESEHESNS